MGYNRATQHMANIDLTNIKIKGMNSVMTQTQVYINYTPADDPYMLNPDDVESIVIEKNERKDDKPIASTSLRSNRTLVALQLLRDSRSEEDGKHVTSLNVCVTFKALPSGGQPKAWFGLTDDMRDAVDSGAIKAGMEIAPNKLVLQLYSHPSPDMPDKTLATIIL